MMQVKTKSEDGLASFTHTVELRDYFAAKAIQGMLAVEENKRYGDRSDKKLSIEEWQMWCVTGLVEHAYRVADAMLKVRKEKSR